jgi:ribosomal protein S14
MSYDDTAERMRCDTCGRFFHYQEPGSSWVFVPDSGISYEENKDQCKKCTEKHGLPFPAQSVRLDMCRGVYGDKR